MHVHVVMGAWEYEGSEILSVYKDSRRAKRELKALYDDAKKESNRKHWYDRYYIETYEVKK